MKWGKEILHWEGSVIVQVPVTWKVMWISRISLHLLKPQREINSLVQ